MAPEETINLWPIQAAADDLLKALVRFQLHQELGEPRLPDTAKLIELAHPEGRNEGLEGIRHWLIDQMRPAN